MAVLAGNGTVGAPSFTFTADTNCGIYRPNADQIGLTFSGVENARFTGTGLAIGASLNPIRQLQISPTATYTTEANLVFYRPAGALDEKYWRTYTDASTDFIIASMDDTFTTGYPGYRIARGTGVDVEFHQFYTGGAGNLTDKMLIQSAGQVMVYGTQTHSANFTIPGSGALRVLSGTDTSNEGITVYAVANFTALQFVRDIGGVASEVGTITCVDVGAQTTFYNTTSDYRLKEDIVDLTGAIDRLKAFKPRRFKWKNDPEHNEVDGFLAHEYDEALPHVVQGEKDGMQTVEGCVLRPDGTIFASGVSEKEFEDGKDYDAAGKEGRDPKYEADMTWVAEVEVPKYQQVDYTTLVPLLTAALQEAVARIEALEALLS